MIKNIHSSKFLGLSILRLLKFFTLALIFPVIFISLLVTLLPKRHASFDVSHINDINQERETDISNNSRASLNSDSTKFQKVNSLDQIRNALASGKYSDLSILRPEYLGEQNIKEAAIISSLKSILLKHLQLVMTYDDWSSWKERIRQTDREKTQARILVDKILAINFQLGRYLETAGLLYSALYVATSNGKLYSAEENLYSLLLQSNEIFFQRTPTAISSRVFLDTLITDDISFSDSIEKLRSELIVSYCKRQNQELDTQFLLLSSIQARFLTAEVITIYSDALKTVAKKVPPRFREELRQHYFQPDRARELSQVSPFLEDAIHQLYRSNILFFLENGESNRAKSNFLQLASIVSNQDSLIELQSAIDSKIDEEKSELAVNPDDQDKKNETSINTQAASNSPPTVRLFPNEDKVLDTSSKTTETYGLIIAVIFLVVLLVKRLRTYALLLVIWLGKLIAKIVRRTLGKKPEDDHLIEELDASIKSGKTVPMTNVPRNRQQGSSKKVVNI